MLASRAVPLEWQYDTTYDGGELYCSALILELRDFFKLQPRNTTALIIARDPAAPLDLAAWCWSTGHVLLAKQHPYYLIQKPTQL